jgi:hypothetical protein
MLYWVKIWNLLNIFKKWKKNRNFVI